MSNEANNKLILAVLQGDDYADTVSELTHNGFFCHTAEYHRRLPAQKKYHRHDRRLQ